MESSSNDWANLLDKYLQMNISPEEMEMLEQQTKTSDLQREQLESLTDPRKFMKEVFITKQFDPEDLWETIHSKPQPASSTRVIKFNRTFRRIVAAVITGVIFSAGIYLFRNGSNPDYPFLQLADGTEINLQTVPNGVFRKYSEANLIKLDSMVIVEPRNKHEIENIHSLLVLYTPPGQRFGVQLPDGSIARLNASSSIKFPTAFPKNERTVSVTGESRLEITKSDKVPFIVRVLEATIRATGTSFNINAYDENSIITTLFDGKITLFNGKSSMSLNPGQQVLIRKTTFQPVSKPNIYGAIAWTHNYFDFTNMNIKEMMREIERWYDVEVTVDKSVPDDRAALVLPRSMGLTEILGYLDRNYKIKIRLEDENRKITVTGLP